MTSSYRKGYQKELEGIKRLKEKKEFHTVLRSAGSRSPFDVIAIGRRRILLLQVKSGKGRSKKEKMELRKLKIPKYARKLLKIYQKGSWRTITIK